MKILFDHQAFRNQRYGGISLYISKLIKTINLYHEKSAILTGPYFENENLSIEAYDESKMLNFIWKKIPNNRKRILSDIYSCYKINYEEYDVLHPTYYSTYFLKYKNKNKPWTITFHDMIHEILSNRFIELKNDSLINNKNILVNKSNKLIAISECTKADMVNYYNINPDRIKVIYHGAPFEIPTSYNKLDNNGTYILFVGKRSNYKNFNFFIKSIAEILIKYKVNLLCLGGGSFNNEELELIKRLRVKNLVKYENLTNENLPDFYKNAIAFIFPSLYEGFGLPILEAFTCDCPCILSETGSLPEIGANAALYFNPESTDSLVNAMTKLLDDSDQRVNMIKLGKKRLLDFNWEITAKKTLDFYQNL